MKVTDLLFGKTQIFVVTVGWFLVATGAMMIVRPEWARSKMNRQGLRIIKGYLLLAVLFVCSLALSWAQRHGTGRGWLAALAVIGLLFWSFTVLTGKVAARIKVFAEKATLPMLRYYAAAQIVIGALMLLLRRRLII